MKPVIQTRTGATGNCFEACIASILELKLEEVPDFSAYSEDQTWVKKLNKWLSKRGLVYFEVNIDVSCTNDFFKSRNFYHILIGDTVGGGKLKHAVVGNNGKMVYDPHPSNIGIIKEKILTMGLFVYTGKKGVICA